MNIHERMQGLITTLRAADTAYYRDDTPILTDHEYDALTDELQILEARAGYALPDSPTQTTSGETSTAFAPIRHVRPMLSTQKTKDAETVVRMFAQRAAVMSYKLDGLSLILRYDSGRLTYAATRGKGGIEGEDVTHTVRRMASIPGTIPVSGVVVVRGEGVIPWAAFKGGKHPRNTAAGAVRSKNPDSARRAGVEFVAYELVSGMTAATKHEQWEMLAGLGFKVVEYVSLTANHSVEDARRALAGFDAATCAYPVDGVVAEYDDLKYAASLGETAHHRKSMIAYKWADKEYTTHLIDIELKRTPTGAVSVVACFEPVEIDGATVQRASMSMDALEGLCLGLGDELRVYKANAIIPQIAANITRSGTCVSLARMLASRIAANGGSARLAAEMY